MGCIKMRQYLDNAIYSYKLITETGCHEFITKAQAIQFIQVLRPFGDKYLFVETVECLETGKVVNVSIDDQGRENLFLGNNLSFLDARR
jgi:hypothetical protein